MLIITEQQTQIQIKAADLSSNQNLPDLQVRLVHSDADWTDKISVIDTVDGSELQVSLWRTVRIPEDGKAYDLPAGFGRFPLVDAAQLRDSQPLDNTQDMNCLFPMYDREAMYMEFVGGQYAMGPGDLQRPYAIRPFVGGINVVSGEPLEQVESTVPPSSARPTAQTRVGERQQGEVVGIPPSAEQDYLVADALTNNTTLGPQWLDGIAESQGRVKQFVAVPFGEGTSIESQKTGKDNAGGIQFEIIPSLPLHRLRQYKGRQITIYTKAAYYRNTPPVQVDAGALVWDYMHTVSQHFGCNIGHFYCFFNNQRMEPLYTLAHFGVTDGCTILVMHKMRGGGRIWTTAKRMALGAGGAISQNIRRDEQPPGIWDRSRAIRINIQITSSLGFEDLTGLVAPPTPISFDTYEELGIPFFQHYIEDTQAISGDFGGILSVGSFDTESATGTTTQLSGRERQGQDWTATPDRCDKCYEGSPFRL